MHKLLATETSEEREGRVRKNKVVQEKNYRDEVLAGEVFSRSGEVQFLRDELDQDHASLDKLGYCYTSNKSEALNYIGPLLSVNKARDDMKLCCFFLQV